ncbi:helix-turn-helix domain-containing protein [Brevibacillus laterosporus]|uniref:Helix-turn-helix transcriptional regulator n=1 Tax=Brevibacillus laterosporus TaxID=1465 RepID=A0AAP3GAS2_BRELA|nr:helix-turn-helix transcriptional regulator [Brevibacillus laterosporus]MCR8978734.1 helix-turn-helix transcriptional regulator [Brevibacillus laterosporus]MCZ0805890.1 helix-turn-helix transcriptional regulator [Brevibacillus laterosporus]MCZ0824344.1 helix-turn-helix transcriptional regulator [Brevibacillus laterosporus]MCZ0848248.1 helix-turn-helix transcriptional regulator [Brevibacillus laterosporus]
MNITLGSVIGKYREEMGLSINDVEKTMKITRLKRIEDGTTSQPKLQTLDKLIKFLKIPIEEIAEMYVNKVNNKEVVMEILQRVIQVSTEELLFNITHHFITISNSINAGMSDLKIFASSIKEKKHAAILYSVLAKHAITYSRNDLLAEFLFSEYMIQRDIDITKSYYLGKRLIDHAHMLDEEKRIIALYKVGVHANLLKQYEDSNNYLKIIVQDHKSDSPYKEKAYHAYYNNLINIGQINEGECYLEEYALKFNKYDSSNYIIDKAIIYAKTNRISKAIFALEEYMKNYEENHDTIIAINLLMELYIKTNRFDQARNLYQYEGSFERLLKVDNLRGPFNQTRYGLYLRLKGRIEYLVGNVRSAVNIILDSMEAFSAIGFKDEFLESMRILYTFNQTQLIGHLSPGKTIFDTNVQIKILELLNSIIQKERRL